MDKYEYKVVRGPNKELEECCNAFGNMGFRLITASNASNNVGFWAIFEKKDCY